MNLDRKFKFKNTGNSNKPDQISVSPEDLRLAEMYPGLTLDETSIWDSFLKRFCSEPGYTFEKHDLKGEGSKKLLQKLQDLGYIEKSWAWHPVEHGATQYKVIKNPRIKT